MVNYRNHQQKLAAILALGFLFLSRAEINAQTRLVGGCQGGIVQPIGSLNNRFRSTEGYALEIGYTNPATNNLLTFSYLQYRLQKPNETRLYFDDVKMKFANQAVGINSYYPLLRYKRWLTVDLGGGLTLNRWSFQRQAYSGVDTLDHSAPYDSVITLNLVKFGQRDWSWGGKIGGSLTLSPVRWLQLGWGCYLHLIIAELWPNLDLHLENVSGLFLLESFGFVRFNFYF